MKKQLLSLLQKGLNRYLGLDPESSSQLQKLNGKVVKLILSETKTPFYLIFTENNIEIKEEYELNEDTIIEGSLFSLLRVGLNKSRRHTILKGISIQGDVELAQQVIHLFDHIEIDWEEQASRIVGDNPAYQLGKAIQIIKRKFKGLSSTLSQNLKEYIQEEKNLFPTIEMLQHFFQDIDNLRMDLDRIEKKIDQLKNRI